MIQNDISIIVNIIVYSVIAVIIIFTIVQFIISKKRNDNNYILCYIGIGLLIISIILYICGFFNLFKPTNWFVTESYIVDKYSESSSGGDIGSPTYYIKVYGYNGSIQTCNNCEKIGDKVYAVIDSTNNKLISTYKMADYKYIGNKLK